MSGDSIARMTQDVGEKFLPGTYTAQTSAANAQGGANAYAFQRAFNAQSPLDDTMRLRMGISDEKGNTPYGQLTVGDKELRWLRKKADIQEIANFDQWFGQNFNIATLAGRSFAQSIYPEYYAEREKFMRERTEMALRVKLIQLRGPKTEEDLQLWYLLNTGRVQLPNDWDQIGPALAPGAALPGNNAASMTKRLVRMPQIVGAAQRVTNAAGANTAQAGASNDSALNGLGAMGQFQGNTGFMTRYSEAAQVGSADQSVMGNFWKYMQNADRPPAAPGAGGAAAAAALGDEGGGENGGVGAGGGGDAPRRGARQRKQPQRFAF